MKIFLKGVSIILIISAAISIIGSLITIGGGGVIAGVGAGLGISSEDTGIAMVAGVAAIGMGVILLISSAFSLITGIFGLMGAKGNAGKLKAALVMGWISLVLCMIGAVMNLAGGVTGESLLNAVLQVALPLLFVVAASGVKKESVSD